MNFDKTCYIHISKNPVSIALPIEGFQDVMPAKDNKTVYLGMHIVQSNTICDQIDVNLKNRNFNVKKFHDWMDVNIETPFSVKIKVLYSRVFAAITYGCEAWFSIDMVAEKLLKIERSLLKRILCVRSSTPNDLIYAELSIPDIISKIKKRQFTFFRKVILLDYEDATIRSILDMCLNLPCYQYYLDINPKVTEENIGYRRQTISEQTYNSCYTSIVGFKYCNALYDGCLVESRRAVITRWRFSNHKLRIETGRYKHPKIPREERRCNICPCVEDEEHAIFHCALYNNVRVKYVEIFTKYANIQEILNPKNVQDAYQVGSFLLEVEKIHKEINDDIT